MLRHFGYHARPELLPPFGCVFVVGVRYLILKLLCKLQLFYNLHVQYRYMPMDFQSQMYVLLSQSTELTRGAPGGHFRL